MQHLIVRIIKCDEPAAWYADLVGETFDVYPYDSDSYVLKKDYDRGNDQLWRHIKKDEVERIEDAGSFVE